MKNKVELLIEEIEEFPQMGELFTYGTPLSGKGAYMLVKVLDDNSWPCYAMVKLETGEVTTVFREEHPSYAIMRDHGYNKIPKCAKVTIEVK